MRAIDADAFKEYITSSCEDMKHLFNDGGTVAKLITESFCKDIDEQPTIQPEPSQVARDIARIVENEQDMRVIAQPEIIYCKDCRKHNKRIGFDENFHPVWKEDACPLETWRGKAQGHEFDYQFCAYAERREVTT